MIVWSQTASCLYTVHVVMIIDVANDPASGLPNTMNVCDRNTAAVQSA